jgi:hypothetical protein
MSSHTQKPNPGDQVILLKLPPGFLDDLPIEDQAAIKAVIGKPVLLSQFDADGRAELSFTDASDVHHLIYVSPNLIRHG